MPDPVAGFGDREALDAYLEGDLPRAQDLVETLLARDPNPELRKKLDRLGGRIEARLEAGR